MIALTITSCKRLEFFFKTINSLTENMIDIDKVDIILHYDDSSSEEDRQKMNSLLTKSFPGKIIATKYFEKDYIKSSNRHMEIMNHWKNDLKKLNVKYVFHTEDDWLYNKRFSINESIRIFEMRGDVAYVSYSQQLRDFPSDMQPNQIIDNFWEWVYLEDRRIQDLLFLDTVEMQSTDIPGYWCYYINWPYFGFRPGVHHVDRISTLDDFNNSEESFELEFAKRYAKKFKSFCYIQKVCEHLGWRESDSSYNLNSSKR